MTYEHIFAAGVIFLYSLGTLGILLGTLSAKRSIARMANLLTLVGFVLHSLVAGLVLLQNTFSELSVGYLTQLLAWCFIFLYLLAWRWLRYPFLGLTAAPLALLLYALSLRMSDVPNIFPENLSGLFFGLHIAALYFSIGLLAMAFGAGLFFLYTENKLKKKTRIKASTSDLPSLSTCDKVNMIAVLVGFPLYTIGLMSGFIWAPMATSVVENPKVIISLFIWLLYAILFYQRAALGFRGRKTASMAIGIFVVSALSFGLDYSMSHHSMQLLP